MGKYIVLVFVAILFAGCSFLGIQTKVEDARQAAIAQMEKAACANVEETKALVKGSRLEAVDWASICAGK